MRPLAKAVPASKLWKALAGALVLAACGGGGAATTTSSGAGGHTCTPGAQLSCACPGGTQGIQICKPDGSGLDACEGCATGSGGGDAGAGTTSSTTGTGGAAACGDTTSNANNCGACGHHCPSGTCTASLCQPVTLAAQGGYPTGIVVDATNVYFTGGILGAVTKAPIDGGGAVALTKTTDGAAYALAVDAANVYYVDSAVEMLVKVPLNGVTQPTMLAPVLAGQHSLGMGVDATSVYVLGTTGGTGSASAVVKVPIAGGAVTPLGTPGAGGGLVQNATSVFWIDADTGHLLSVPTSGGATTILVPDASEQGEFSGYALALDATSVYWVDIGAGAVMKVPIGGGTPTVLVSGAGSANGMAVDATDVYWTDAVAKSVMKVPVGGGAKTTVAIADYPPFGIALDATNVYWTVPMDSSVLMVPK